MEAFHLVVVTGLSGSGKSTAIKAFEDIGFFCIDNLPVPLLPDFLSLCQRDMPDIRRIALGIDIREGEFLKGYDKIFKTLEDSGHRFEIIFLEADIDTLQRRYSQTRRLHPVATSESRLLNAIREEREKLMALRTRATRIIDTGNFSVHQLKELVTRTYSKLSQTQRLSIQVLSFGFKYGLPVEADLVMDVRFLPNPYYIDELRNLDGCTPEVGSWVLQWPAAREFISDYSNLLLKLIPWYIQEAKRYLTIAVGCTGGKHRSVVFAREIYEMLQKHDYFVNIYHRDIHME
jgi:UPF0042 nucleotide-binding protein